MSARKTPSTAILRRERTPRTRLQATAAITSKAAATSQGQEQTGCHKMSVERKIISASQSRITHRDSFFNPVLTALIMQACSDKTPHRV